MEIHMFKPYFENCPNSRLRAPIGVIPPGIDAPGPPSPVDVHGSQMIDAISNVIVISALYVAEFMQMHTELSR